MDDANSPWPKRIGIGVLVAAAVTVGALGVRMVDARSDPDPAVAVEIRDETRLASADDPIGDPLDDDGLPGLDDLADLDIDEMLGDLEACVADLMADLGSLDIDPTALPDLPPSCNLDDLNFDDLQLPGLEDLDDLDLDDLLPDDLELPNLDELELPDLDELDLGDGEFGDTMNELLDELLNGFDELLGADDGG